MTTRTAQCRCGQLKAHCANEPVRRSVCHCVACKQRTGSAFAWNTTWEEADVTIEGASREWRRFGDTGGAVTYGFCETCGSTVFWRTDMRPGRISVAVGMFADKDFPEPLVQVYADRAAPWVSLAVPVEVQPNQSAPR